LEVNFKIQNQPMGSEITNAGNPTLSVSINDPDLESTTSVTVFSGVAGSGSAPTQLTSVNNSNSFNYTHLASSNVEYYYYLYIVQADGDKIWTAPIWYTRNDNTIIQAPMANFIDTLNICSNNPIVFEDNSLNSPNTWWWSAPGAYPNNSSLQHPTFNFPNAGTYQVALVVSNQAGSDTVVKNITVQASPNVNIQAIDSICKGASVTLLAVGANTYIWSNNVNNASTMVSPQVTTNYTVTGFQNTCYDTATIAVKVYQALTTPIISTNADTLISNYNNGNQWFYYFNAIAGAISDQYLPTVTGIYQVQVTDSLGCKSEFSLPAGVTLGVVENDFELRNAYMVYPNPSQGKVNITSQAVHYNIEMEVNTVTGYLVHKQTIAECSFLKPVSVDLSHLSKGIYIIKFQTALGVYESKIQIE
jgi:PKD repeat protein